MALTDSVKEAALYINKIMHDRCILIASSADQDVSIMTAIIDILENENKVLFDYSGSKPLDHLIRQSRSIDFSTHIDDIHIHFSSGPVEDALYDAKPAFSIQMPQNINRVQRRECYRATTPLSERPDCFIEHHGKRYKAIIVDISIGGIGAIVEHASFKAGDVIDRCRIDTPIGEEIEASLEIVHVGPKLDSGKETRYGCKFKGGSRFLESQLQRYVTYLQGLEMARRRELMD